MTPTERQSLSARRAAKPQDGKKKAESGKQKAEGSKQKQEQKQKTKNCGVDRRTPTAHCPLPTAHCPLLTGSLYMIDDGVVAVVAALALTAGQKQIKGSQRRMAHSVD